MKIKDCGIVFTDGNWIESKDQSDNGIRLLQTGNIGNGVFLEKEARAKYISEETFENLKCTEIFEGDILISRLPEPVGRACIVPKRNRRMITAVDCTILRVDESVIDKKYLLHFLKSQKYFRTLTGKLAGTTRKRVSRKNLGEIEVDLPDRPTQEHIGNVIENLELIIQKKKEQLEEYDTLIKSRFVEMFGDVGLYPSKAFKECTNFIDYRGKTPKLSDDGTIRMINAKSVGKGLFKVVDEYVTEEVYDEWMKRGFPKGGDILFVTEGHTFGNVCRIPEDMTKFALGQRVITIQGNTGILDNIYLETYMQFRDFKSDIDRYKTGSSAQGIRSKELIKINIPLPDYNLQLEFANIVRNIDKLKFKEKDYCLKYRNIMIDILKGEDHVLQL